MMNKTAQQKTRTVGILSPILGLTWVFGVLSVNKETLVFQYLFVIFNSLQGLAIFICYCLIPHQMSHSYTDPNYSQQPTASTSFCESSSSMTQSADTSRDSYHAQPGLSKTDSSNSRELLDKDGSAPVRFINYGYDTDQPATECSRERVVMTAHSSNAVIDLDEWDKLMIVVAAALFLMLALVCLVCILSPACCLHKYCPFKYDDEEKVPLQPVYGSLYDLGKTPLKKGYSVKGQHGSHWLPMVPLRESELSDWSDFSAPEVIEMKNKTFARDRKWSQTSDYSSSASTINMPPQLESRLAYGITIDRNRGQLKVRVIQLGNFTVTDPDGAMAPYVKVRLYRTPKQFFTFKLRGSRDLPRSNLESEHQTKILRRADNPVFNEVFTCEVDIHDLSSYLVRLLVCDFDKFSRHVVIGETLCDLSKMELLSGEEVLYNDQLLWPQEENLGEVRVALMYLPTAEKLSITLINVRGLRIPDSSRRSIEAYIKIVLMYDGRPLKKTKTAPKSCNPSPSFNETFVFDVPAYQLDRVYLSLSVIGVDKDKEDGRHLIGRLYIGVNFDENARAQWLEMVQNARKQVACWHKLQS